MKLSPELQAEHDRFGLPIEFLPNVATEEQERFYIKAANEWHANHQEIAELTARVERLRDALTRLRDCDWVISLPDRMDAVREIAREVLKKGSEL